MKMRAEINWIIPELMTVTSTSCNKQNSVCHRSPKFFDQKDDQRRWRLSIDSLRNRYFSLTNPEEEYLVIVFVHLEQPENSIFAATYFAVVSDEKGDQPRRLFSEKKSHSPRFLDPEELSDIAVSFTIATLEEVKKLSTVSVRCIIEYEIFDLKESDSDSPSKEAESPIIDVYQISTGFIQQDLEKLFKLQSLTDISFVIDGHELRCHKVILSARSPVFAKMIKKVEAEGDSMDGIKIKNMSFIIFEELVHFIYTDQVFLTERNADSLLAAAKEYSIPLLINKCEIFLYSTSLTVENCAEKLIDVVDKAVHAKGMVMDFMFSNHADVMNSNGWKQLEKSHPELFFEVKEDIFQFIAS